MGWQIGTELALDRRIGDGLADLPRIGLVKDYQIGIVLADWHQIGVLVVDWQISTGLAFD